MRNYLVLFLLFGGLTLTSCSEEASSSNDDLVDQIELDESDSDQDKTDADEGPYEMEEADLVLVWKSYHNQRFSFCVDYPSNFLNPKGEPENHDGNTFANANGSSEMRASGMYNALDETAAEAFERASENDRYYDDERIITYKLQKDNWFVVSGNYNESIFYVKSILIEDTFYTLYFEYHPSEAKKFDEIIKYTTKDFPGC